MDDGYRYARVDVEELAEMAGVLQPLYRQCFTVPPWNETAAEVRALPQRLARHLGNTEAHGHVVHHGSSLAGAIYGWRAPDVFDRALAAVAPRRLASDLVAPAWTVAELMVDERHRRRGLARTLLRRFVAGAERAWLVTHPGADAVALYEATGWRRQAEYRLEGAHRALYVWRPPAPGSPR